MKYIDPRIGMIFKLSQKEMDTIKDKLNNGDIVDENWMKKLDSIDDIYSDEHAYILTAFDPTFIDDDEVYEMYKDDIAIDEFPTIFHHILHEKASLDDFCVLTKDCYSCLLYTSPSPRD